MPCRFHPSMTFTFSIIIIIFVKIVSLNIIHYCSFHILLHFCIVRHLYKMYECCTHSLVRTYITVRAPSTRTRASSSRSRGRNRNRRRRKKIIENIWFIYHHHKWVYTLQYYLLLSFFTFICNRFIACTSYEKDFVYQLCWLYIQCLLYNFIFPPIHLY